MVTLKYFLLIILILNLTTQAPDTDNDDDDISEEAGKKIVAKFVKKRPTFIHTQEKITMNPRDCYVSLTLFPFELYIDLEKAILRIRLISNCFPTRDLVLISNSSFGKEPTEAKHPKSLKLTIFRNEWKFKFAGQNLIKSESYFTKIRYAKARVTSQNFNGNIYINKPNFLEIDTQLSTLNLYKIKKITSPIECPINPKMKSINCLLF